MTICRRKRSSSFSSRSLLQPWRDASLASGAWGRIIWSITLGQNFTAPAIAMSMKVTPMIGARTVLKRSNSPLRLKRTLNSTRDRMSSTKAAVMMACPKFSCSTPASPRRRSAMPTLVGARAVPAEMPSGFIAFPNAIISKVPTMSGRMVPRTATQQAGTPTTLAFSKSKCMPLSKIMSATPAWPISVKTSGRRPQWWLISPSHDFSRHSAKLLYLMPPPPPERRRPWSGAPEEVSGPPAPRSPLAWRPTPGAAVVGWPWPR
mmetsp:Transcript_75273/g.234368  ORF Transcript_75273/g.234368 Transcript_75273/m.234368 type:complete len:262 (-) Transcript_75273:786-1571(-)